MNRSKIKIFPSLISADLLNLRHEIDQVAPHCDGFHIDVMDGVFVPNLTWGFPFIAAILGSTSKPLFIHLMVIEPESFARRLDLSANCTVSFHIEAVSAPEILINYLRTKHWRVSIALKPSTDVQKLAPYIALVDEVLLMSVEPGFSGQQFLQSSISRLKELVTLRTQQKLSFSIGMDGGLNANNLPELFKNGLDSAAIASAIFSHRDRIDALKKLYECVK
ncbi:MAG TPA: ribulose-phosphate 3-epimerase [Candidatus Babeliales bacterium]|nr:ribulose-phosphate 3-epimerase [Candidatus Babeliales bacterium]